jgi:sugar (pentulose or hexulose) kinase
VTETGASIVVTLDIGGSAAKASAYDAARQVCIGQAEARYPEPQPGADPGLFDPDGWWLAAVAALRGLQQRLDQPAARYLGITVSAIRIPFVLLDADGAAVMPGLLNTDGRAWRHVEQAAAPLGADGLYRLTGHWPSPGWGLPKLLWTRDRYPDAWRSTRSVLQLHDWFVYMLSGVIASEPSSAGMSQMLDVRAGRWAISLLDSLNISNAALPGLLPAGSRAGGLLRDVAEQTGLAAGTPVHIGGGDTHMSALSAAAGDGIPVVVAGTTAPVVLAVPEARTAGPAQELYPLLISDHVVAGQRILEANAGQTGLVAMRLDGLNGMSGGMLAQALADRGFTLERGGPDEPLTVLSGQPFFGPFTEVSWRPPTVIGLRDSCTGEDVYQACLHGICLAIRGTLGGLLRQSGTTPPFIVATGGMSRSASWAQLLADVTGTEVRVRPLDRILGRAGALVVTGENLPGHDDEGDEHISMYEPRAETIAEHDAAMARYQQHYRNAAVSSADSR